MKKRIKSPYLSPEYEDAVRQMVGLTGKISLDRQALASAKDGPTRQEISDRITALERDLDDVRKRRHWILIRD